METKRTESLEPVSDVGEDDRTIQDQMGSQQEEEAIFKKPTLISKAQKQAMMPEEEEETFKKPLLISKKQKQATTPEEEEETFKKPLLISRKQKQATKTEEKPEEEEETFKKPVFISRTQKQATEPEEKPEEEEETFKKPVFISRTQKQATEPEEKPEEEEETFKKPVFISRTQKQLSKPEEQVEEGNSNKHNLSTSTKHAPFKSPAQVLVETSSVIPYKEPEWSGIPKAEYKFEVLKSGIILEEVPLIRPFTVIGRQSRCDLVLEHPSLSRFHCVIQYRAVAEEGKPTGFYAFDLNSTHGSYHNKHRMKPCTYYRLHVGHLLKLGGSTRSLILQGPEEDQEPESELSATELMAAAAKQKRRLEQLESGEESEKEDKCREEKLSGGEEQEEKESGVNWGFREDAIEEEEEEEEGEGAEGGVNPFASASEELHLDDPKKTLRGWFERQGYDPPNYTLDEISPGCCKCTVELPVEAAGRGSLVVSVEHRGRRKDAVVQCAMEACRTLDRRHLLRQAKHESHQRKKRDWAENDYYDSDEDDFFDRTGDIQRRRLRRMKASGAGGAAGGAETYESLMRKYNDTTEELSEMEGRLAAAEAVKEGAKGRGGGTATKDDLDAYMLSLQSQAPDKHKRVMWKLRAVELRKDELKLRRLANIARPLGVPELQPYQPQHRGSEPQVPGRRASEGKPRGFAGNTTTQTKEPLCKVHKIFLEEEPESKVRLRRLDDNDEEAKPVARNLEPSKATGRKGDSHTQPCEGQPIPVHSSHAPHTVTERESELQMLRVQEENSPRDEKSNLSEAGGRKSESAEIQETSNTEESSGGGTLRKSEAIVPKRSSSEGGQPEKKARVLGPALPPNLAHLTSGSQDHLKPRKKEKKRKKYDEDGPNYDNWVPPLHQSGDGRTALNDRLGY